MTQGHKCRGFRSKTRHKLRKRPRDGGKITINRQLQQFSIGDKVCLSHEPAIHDGMPHPRFKNAAGTILKKQGEAYLVEIKDGNKTKKVVSYAIHLKRNK